MRVKEDTGEYDIHLKFKIQLYVKLILIFDFPYLCLLFKYSFSVFGFRAGHFNIFFKICTMTAVTTSSYPPFKEVYGPFTIVPLNILSDSGDIVVFVGLKYLIWILPQFVFLL